MNKLQLYFKFFEEHYHPKTWDWYTSLNRYIGFMQNLIEKVKALDIESLDENALSEKLQEIFSESNVEEIKNLDDFLNRYLFIQDNGMGDIGQGTVWESETNQHRTEIKSRLDVKTLATLLKEEDIKKANEILWKIVSCSSRNYPGVKNRFLRAMYPEKMASADAENKFWRLISAIENKLGIKIVGDDIIDRHEYLCNLIESDDIALKQMFTWMAYEMLSSELDMKKAIVFYGSPGTGKTFKAKLIAKEAIDSFRLKNMIAKPGVRPIETVQFHPSYSYEDFVEGIRPSKDKELKLYNGSFKKFCLEHGKKEIKLYSNKDFLEKENFVKVDYNFSEIKIIDLDDEQKKILEIQGKEFAGDYTISDIIEPAFFIIDEINRAELSRVFGELMYCLEYRGYTGKIKTQYAYLCSNEEDESKFFWENGSNWFFIPQNIYLIGTMNNIDRSVDSFDFALRRRFSWERVDPNEDLITDLLKKDWSKELSKSFKDLNNAIAGYEVLGKDYCIGHAYALQLESSKDDFKDIKQVKEYLWNEFLKPLLEEYLRGLGDDKLAQQKIDEFSEKFNS